MVLLPTELALLIASEDTGQILDIAVTGCAYTCCARGWVRRDGYEQLYRGRVSQLLDNGFMLTSMGMGTVSYHVIVLFDELEAVAVG